MVAIARAKPNARKL